MSKRMILIFVNFGIILIVSLVLFGQIKKYQGIQTVYVAKVQINKGAQIQPGMLEPKDITLNAEDKSNNKELVSYYDDAIKDQNTVIGKYAAYDILPGEIVLKRKIAGEDKSSESYLSKIPAGYFVKVFTPDKTDLTSGLISIGDYVDLYVTTKESGYVDTPLLRKIRVYDIRTEAGTSINDKTVGSDGQQSAPAYLVFALNDSQIKELDKYESAGNVVIRTALRKREPYQEELFSELIKSGINQYPAYDTGVNGVGLVDDAREAAIIDQIKKAQLAGKVDDNTTTPVNTQPANTTAPATTQTQPAQ